MLVLSISASKKLDHHNKMAPLLLSFRNFLAIPLLKSEQNFTFTKICSRSFFKCCGILQNAHSKLQSDCKPFLPSDPEKEWFQIVPWAVTSLWANQARGSSCCSPLACPNRARCKKCALYCSWGEQPYLEALAESTREHSRLTSRFLDSGTQRIWVPLYSNWKGGTSGLWKCLSHFRGEWY